MENTIFKLASYQNLGENREREIISSSPLNHPEGGNLSVKADMADELQRMGLPASAIFRLLNITCHRRYELAVFSSHIDSEAG